MSTKGRGRGKKAAATAVEATQENVVDSTSEVKSEEEPAAVEIKDKKSQKRKPAAENGSAESSGVPVKRGRGKPKEKQDTSEIDAKETPVEKETKPKRGGRRGTPVESYAEEPIETEAKSAPKKKRGKKAATPPKVEDSEPEPEPKKAAKGKRGKKEVAAIPEEVEEPVEPEEPEEPEAAANGDIPEADQSNRGTPADEEEEEERESPKPVKRGRGRKAAPAKEEKKPIKTAGAKKMLAEQSKGRKKGGGRDSKNEESSENGAQEEEVVPPPAAKKEGGRGRKRAAVESDKPAENGNQAKEEEVITAQKKSKKEVKAKQIKINGTATNYDKLDFSLDKEFNLKISSWNVAGLRSWITKGGLEYIDHEKPDILCLQEIKCSPDQVPDEARIPGYHPYWLCKPGGYAGVAIYSRIMPINVEYGIGDDEQDDHGRIMTAEYEKFYLVAVYVPNSGRGLVTLPKRMRWDQIFHDYLTKLNNKKPVIIAGDLNVSHQEIDLANPKGNKKNAGFTQEERDGMTKLLSLGFVDSFRHLYPDKEKAYTYWTYMGGARARNVGWRLDYFILSEKLTSKLVDNVIRTNVLGSDHCPITLFLNL